MTDRHQCEVRQILRWRTDNRERAVEYLERVEKMRGKGAADRLRLDAADQWEKGNRGNWGEWK